MNTNVTGFISKSALTVKKHLPEILTVVSALGTVAAVVLAVKESRKADAILEEHDKKMEALRKVKENPEEYLAEGETYTEEDYRKDLIITYTETGKEFVKIYWKSALCALGSIVCGFSATGMLRSRNASLAALYMMTQNGWNEYRERVRDKFGEQQELDIFHGVDKEEIVETYVDEKGKEKTKKTTKTTVSPLSPYTVIFAEFNDDGTRNPNWSDDYEKNLMFLKAEQRYANDRLIAKGHIILAEIKERLGLPIKATDYVVGWFHDKLRPTGDNYIDFGIDRTPTHNFDNDIHDHNACVVLDFNVDGPILDYLPQ